MLRLTLFEGKSITELDKEVLAYVNKNIRSILRVTLDYITDSPELIDDILPRRYLINYSGKIVDLFYELYEIVCSRTMRNQTKIKYDYLLYHIFLWWEEIRDDESDLIPEAMDISLKQKILEEKSYWEEGDNVVYEMITDFSAYYDICFDDIDFSPDSIDAITSIYLYNRNIYNEMFRDVVLDDYVDFMASDLKEMYLDTKSQSKLETTILSKSELILNEIKSCIRALELRVIEMEKRSEVELSNEIFYGLQRVLAKCNFQTEREATIGRAEKALGETDLYIYENDNVHKIDWCVIENKRLEGFRDQYGQLLGYLNQNFSFGVTISINKEKNLEKAMEFIKLHLMRIKQEDDVFKIVNISTNDDHGLQFFVSSHQVPENPSKCMDIYHFVLNLSDIERKKRALSARH